jgi:hypothetical protein
MNELTDDDILAIYQRTFNAIPGAVRSAPSVLPPLFYAVVTACIAADRAKRAPQWISVADRMPADETPVIALLAGLPVIAERCWDRPGYEDTYNAYRYWDSPTSDGQEWDAITHWLPLPTAPKEQA